MTDTTTPTRSDVLRALADRVERGESGREIDYEIARAAFPHIGEARFFAVDDEEPIFFSEPYRKQPAPNYTTSLDATEALRQAVLPGSRWSKICNVGRDGLWFAQLRRAGTYGMDETANDTSAEPAARLSALLRALAAARGKEG